MFVGGANPAPPPAAGAKTETVSEDLVLETYEQLVTYVNIIMEMAADEERAGRHRVARLLQKMAQDALRQGPKPPTSTLWLRNMCTPL